MANEIDLKVDIFLKRIIDWAKNEPELKALALVGSYARGNANPESDVDLLLMVSNPGAYLRDRDWVNKFGKPTNIIEEDWGKVTSLRIFYEDGLEVEYGLCNLEWGADPSDEGDAQVVKNGLIILYEKYGHLSSKLEESSSML